MRVVLGSALALCLLHTLACAPKENTMIDETPPRAAVRPHQLEMHGHARTDDYYWLRDRTDPEVIAYLEAENAYLEAATASTRELRTALYEEMAGRIQAVDAEVPYRKGDYFYYERYEEDGEYPIYCRKRGSLDAEEEILLDGNRLAEGQSFFSLRGLRPSPDHGLLAYAVDTQGRRKYTIRFRDLATGEDLPDEIPEVTSDFEWANDNRTVFYTRQHPETLRWYRIQRHELGSDAATDPVVYEEADEEWGCSVFRTKSGRYVGIDCEQTLAKEIWLLEADRPEGDFRVVQEREEGHEYSVDHLGDELYLRTNLEGKNFGLMKTSVDSTGKDSWQEVVPARDDTYLEAFQVFSGHLVFAERRGGLTYVRILPLDGSEEHEVDFGEPAYDAYFRDNHEIDSTKLRFRYTSLTTPPSTFDYDLNTRERILLREKPVLGGFDKANYVTERLYARADDGRRIPISLVYRRDLFAQDGSRPLLLYGYGSYGSTTDPSFRDYRLSLLDRGFVFAIAHVRGGQLLGRAWYEDGKLLKKKNTFTDFIDVAEHLVAEGYTSPEHLFAEGGSAGGLLMGAITNMAPELFEGVISRVPFVDVVTTMLDPDIPLTTSEYDEWGDPNDKASYDYMLSYSPYDQIEAKAYPNLLVTTGLHDSQVQYWEPAKYVAKLRAMKTDDNLLLLHTEMEAGHSGTTGRFKSLHEKAREYAFLLDLAGITE